jgi:hypothetical protein
MTKYAATGSGKRTIREPQQRSRLHVR